MYIACIIVVLFYQGLFEKQPFIADEHVTLNKYILTTTTFQQCRVNCNPGYYA